MTETGWIELAILATLFVGLGGVSVAGLIALLRGGGPDRARDAEFLRRPIELPGPVPPRDGLSTREASPAPIAEPTEPRPSVAPLPESQRTLQRDVGGRPLRQPRAEEPEPGTPAEPLSPAEPSIPVPPREPAVSQRGVSEPAASESTVSEPTISEPTVSEPTLPEPALSEPTVADATAPELAVPEPAAEPEARKVDWFAGLRKTRAGWVAGLGRLLGSRRTLDAAALEELEDLLFGADLGTRTADQLLEVARSAGAPDAVRAAIRAEALSILVSASGGAPGEPVGRASRATPHVVMVVGVNGAGKTTSIGKLAHRAIRGGEDVILAAADTFRAAAIDQLQVWAERCGAEFVRTRQGGDPAAVAFDAVKAANARSADRVFIDTAGRLQTDKGLMDELQKIARVVKKELPEAPHEVLLVLDAHTGQNAIRQAQEFTKAVPVTGIVLTKLDGTAKGGVVLGITQETGIPVRYVGIGEGIEDLADFDAEAFVDALFSA